VEDPVMRNFPTFAETSFRWYRFRDMLEMLRHDGTVDELRSRTERVSRLELDREVVAQAA
jgi:hypothetical protein